MDVDEAVGLAASSAEHSGFFFDFDGTLAPIQLDPGTARPIPGVAATLGRLAERAALVAIVSARPVDYLVRSLGQVTGLRLYGLYGLEQMTVDGERVTHPAAAARIPTIRTLIDAARRELPAEVGVEDKRISVALHFRAAPHLQDVVVAWAAEQASKHGLATQPGRMVIELRPPVSADKGTVVAEALDGLAGAWYFGDDVADLEAFAALDRIAAHRAGFRAVRVAISHDEVDPRLVDAADLVLDSPTALAAFLQAVLVRLTGASG